MKTIETQEKFVELRAKGQSYDTISKTLGVSKQTLINWSKDLTDKINNFKALEIDAIQEKFLANKQSRIEMFGEILKKIRDEINNRDLTGIPTWKLVDMLFKTDNALKAELDSLLFRNRYETLSDPDDLIKLESWKLD